jgi:hypothetical protein
MRSGALFQSSARSSFLEFTGSLYRGMCDRLAKKKIPPPEFTLEDFRRFVLARISHQVS